MPSYPDTRYLGTSSAFTGEVNLFGADFWGNPKHAMVVEGGNLNLYLTNFSSSGQTYYLNFPKSTGSATIHNASVSLKASFVNSGHEKQAAVTSTVTEVPSYTAKKMGVWENNLSMTLVFNSTDALINRSKWTITASHQ